MCSKEMDMRRSGQTLFPVSNEALLALKDTFFDGERGGIHLVRECDLFGVPCRGVGL